MYQETPIDEFIQKYIERFEELGYTAGSIRPMQRHCRAIIKLAEELQQDVYTPDVGSIFLERIFKDCVDTDDRALYQGEPIAVKLQRALRTVNTLNDFYRGLPFKKIYLRKRNSVLDEGQKSLIDGFGEMLAKKGYAACSVTKHKREATYFLEFFATHNISLKTLDVHGIDKLIAYFAKYNGVTTKGYLTGLKMLLIHLFERGMVPHDLSMAVPSVRIYRKSAIPSVWPYEDLERVLKSIDRNSPIGKRDYVMFLLAAHLGIRGCDIRMLKISDIDWDCDEIRFVQSKTQSPMTLPLFSELGDAIIEYLRYGRPNSPCKELLLRHNPPFDPFPSNCGLNNIILRCMKRAGVDIPKNRKHGVHSLRHTFASDLLAQGVSFEKIADLLGHNNFDTVSVYLKTQNDALRECSLNLSEVTRNA